MQYIIKPAAIAAVVFVYAGSFPLRYGEFRQDYIYQSKEKEVQKSSASEVEFKELPETVQFAIKQHFDMMFRLPYKERETYLYMMKPIVLEV